MIGWDKSPVEITPDSILVSKNPHALQLAINLDL